MPSEGKTMRLDGVMTVRKFEELVVQHPQNELYRFSLSKAFFDMGRFQDAIPHLETALQLRPEWGQAHLLMGRCCAALNYFEHARAYYNRALEVSLDPQQADLRNEVLHALRSLG